MRIEFEAKTTDDTVCAGNNCPARYRVVNGPGGKVFIGKKLADMDAATRAQLADKIGPDEDAVWVPDDLL
jgi:hypothetical protein